MSEYFIGFILGSSTTGLGSSTTGLGSSTTGLGLSSLFIVGFLQTSKISLW